MKNLDIKSIRCMTVRLVLSAVLVISIILLRSPGFCAEQQDPQLMNGWPQSVGEKLKGGPVCADMDGDGDNEIFAIGKDGKACLWGHDGQLIWQLEGSQGSDISGSGVINNASPRRRRRPGGSAEGAVGRNLSDPVIADVNGDGDKEIIFTGTDSNFERRVYILNHDKTLYSDFRILTKEALSDVPIAPIIVDDLTGDGKNEIIVMLRDITWSYGVVSVFNPRGYQLTGWPFRLEMDEGRYLPLYGGMSLGDIDGNGSKELVVTMSEASSSENACSVFVLGPDGSRIANWRFATDSPEAGMPSIGDVDGDDQGRMEIFFGLNTRVYGFDLAGNALDGWPKETGARVSNEIVLADIDDNADLEVIFTTSASEIHIYHHDGTPFSLSPDDWPKTMPAGTGTVSKLFSSISVGDIDGDEAVDIVAACPSTSDIYAYDISGTLLTGFPKDTEASGSTIVCRPAQLTDIDLDRDIDIVAADIVSGTVYVWNMGEDYDLEFIEWPELRHDPGNTGAYVPLVLSNHRPVITQMADAAYVIGETVNLQVPASDPDPADTTLYYYQTGLPPEVDLGLTTGTLIWDTTNAQARAYPVTFTVADRPENDPDGDRQVSVEMSMTITLDEENHIPVMSTIEDFTGNNAINEEEPFSIPLTADDADAGDTLTYSMDIDLSGATVTAVDSRTGRFDWTPSFEQGVDTPYNIIFSVSDGRGGIDTEAVAIEVNNVNQPPIFSPEIPQDLQLPVDENRELEFLMYGADNDMEPLYFGIEVENPQDFPVTDAGSLVTTLSDHEGRFAWTPGGSDAGTYTVTFTVTDRDPAVNHPDRQIATSPVITINVADSSTAPAAPTGLAAIAPPLTERRIDLSWIVRSDNADHFIIERSPTEDGQFTAIYTTGSNINGYTDNSGLTPETTYYYKVKAVNQEGSSGYTDPAHATTNPDRPATPAPLVAPTVSYDQIILEWANVANETGYQIERSLTGEEDSFVHIATTAADGNGYLDLERSPATVYYYRVRAVNLGGYSDYTLTLTVITAPETPTATASTTARGITVTWAAVTGATGYRLQRGTSTSEASFDYTTSFPETETSHYDDQMANAGTYYYRVCVIRPQPIGESPYSAPASAVTIPDAPANLTLAAMTTERGITASWTGSTGATGYKLERGTSADPGSFTLAASLLAGVVTHNDTSMTTPGTYYYRVCATNSAGDSPYTDPADPSANAVTIPDAQTGLIAVANDNDIALSWTNPAGNNANNFVIQRGTSADESSFSDIVVNPPIPSNITTYNDTGLTAGTTYHYRVRAENDSGRSLYSNTASAATNPSAPAAPTTLSAVAPEGSQGRIDLSWADNSDNEDNFIVERGPTQDEPFVGIYTSIPNVIGYSDTGLSADTIYYYRVHAVNLGGPSAYTSVASATTNPDLPAVPTGLTATAMTAERGITLRWDVVPNVTGYKLQRGTSAEESSFSEIASFASNITAYNDVTMLNAGTYYYKVCSLDSNVHSAYSDPVNAATIPDLPANLTATGGNNITVSWAHNSTNNAENYTLQRRPDTSGENSFGTISTNSVSPNEYTSYSYSDTAVTGGATYDYRVRFSNQSGDSNYTAPVSAMADPQPPTTYSLSVTAVNGSVAVADAQGAALQPPYNDIAENTVLTLTATPDTGYSFTGWTGATPVQGHPEQATVTMDNNKEVTAAFTGGQANNPPIINTIQGRTVTQPPDAPLSFNATEGQQLELQVSASDPDTGDTFTYSIDMQATPAPPAGINANSINAQTGLFGWTPASDQGGMSYAITFVATDSHNATGTANVVISVADVPADYQITIPVPENGTVAVTDAVTGADIPRATPSDPYIVADGTSIILDARPATDYSFTGWGDGLTGTQDPYPLTVRGNMSITASFTETPPPDLPSAGKIGVNLSPITDFTIGHPFINIAKGLRAWQLPGRYIGELPEDDLTGNDYPKVDAHTIHYMKGYPDGDYLLSYEGTGEIDAGSMGTRNGPLVTADGVTTGVITIDREGTGRNILAIYARNVDSSDPISNLKIIMPHHEAGKEYGPNDIFREEFLDALQPFTSLRFMDWLQTNRSWHTNWADRTHMDDFSYSSGGKKTLTTVIGGDEREYTSNRFGGVPWEIVAALANQTGKDIWINIPSLATDDYLRNLAALLRSELDFERIAQIRQQNGIPDEEVFTIRVEYSNEVWNTQLFFQGNKIKEMAETHPILELTNEDREYDKVKEANSRFRALMCYITAHAMKIMKDEFKGDGTTAKPDLSEHIRAVYGGRSASVTMVGIGFGYIDMLINEPGLFVNQEYPQEFASFADGTPITQVSDIFDDYAIAAYNNPSRVSEVDSVIIDGVLVKSNMDSLFDEMQHLAEDGYVDRVTLGYSGYSNIACATDSSMPPPEDPVLGSPSDLEATLISGTQIDLSWRDVAGDTGYEIERGTNLAGPFAKVGESNRSTAAYSDTEVTSGTDYYYRVRAIRINTNDTAYSNIACPTDSSLPLGYPLPGALWNGGTWGLKATAVSGSQIDLSWKDVASNLNLWVDPPTDSVTYLIERSTSLEGPFTLIYRSSREELDLTTYSDTEITPGVTYYYRVQPKRFVNKLDGLRVNLREIKEFLGPYGIKLTAYEGGQHLEASQRNPANRNLKLLAQYDRRMQETYKKWFNAWFEEGGDLFCHFHLVSEYDNYGSWGLFEGFDQDRELPLRDISDTDNPEDLIKTTAPKWLAIKEFLYPEGEDNQPQPPTEHTLTTSVSQANRGTVTVTNLTAEPDAVLMLPCLVADGTRISFTAIPGDDCIFEKWSIANAPDEFDNPYIINSMTASISITANFGRTTNSQPQFTSPQNGQVFPGTVGQTLTINLSGTDPDGDSTHINAGPSQLGAEIPVVNWQNMLTDNGNGTAEFVWDNPVAAGDYYVQFAVIDRPLGSDGSYPTQMQHALIDVGISIPEPTEPPEVPESLSATASYTAHAIDLTWATAPGATGYRVQRARSADGTAAPAESAYAIITDPPVTGSSYNDTGMPHAGTYFYKVCAANSIGDSAYTAAVSAMTIPDAPTNLRARQAGDGITLFWDDTSFDNNSTNNARWAYVFRSPYSDSNDSFGSAGMFHAAEHYRHDQYNNNNLYTGLTGGTTYTYRVRLGNATGVSGFTNDATATAGSNFPPRPLNPRISFYSQDRIDFEWDDVDGETRYEVQRSEHSGGLESSFSTITSDPHLSADTTLYSDTNGGNGFTPGVTYYYRVGAVGPGGNSPYSYIPVATPGCSLSVIVDPANSGTVAVTSSQQSYLPPFDSIPVNTEITLRATALTGYNFTGWTGATPVLGHPERATITMDRNRQVTADFAADSGQPPPSNQAIFIDHYCTDLSSVPDVWIDQARAQFKIWYSRTSHGKQITDAMRAIQDAANAAGVETPFRFNETSSGGALSLQEANDDLGDETNPDPPAWETATRNLLGPPANPISDINVIMWSWGDGVSHNTVEGIDNYLTAMNRLETDYPNVTFIYMTGHLDGSGTVLPDGNLHQRNNQIRQYCLANNKILYDFADIESFDPSGNEFRSRFANDRTYYDSNGDGINSNHHPDASWAVEWLNTGTNSSLITTDYNAFNSDRRLLIPPMQENTAHTHYLSATQKGRAFWWMMARLAGWSGE